MRCGCFILICLALSCKSVYGDDDFEDDAINSEPISVDNQPKQVYTAPPFVSPQIDGSPIFVDWFADNAAIGKKWVLSGGKKDDVEDSISKYNGEWNIGAPSKVVIDGDMGLIVKTKARHHAIAAKFNRPFKFDGKPLVVQYEVMYEDGQECGGGYLKLLTAGSEENLKQFTDKTPYTIMFGPDKCGQNSKLHFIIRFTNPKNKNISEHSARQPTKSLSSYFDDHKTHLYTLIIKPDESFTVLVDNTKMISGNLLTDLDPSITPSAKIDDPNDKKPDNWDEREKIEDPDAKKPDDWDENAPRKIPNETAEMPSDWLEDEEPLIADVTKEKPKDWDSEMDGEWEASKVPNPKCEGRSGCGKWNRPMMDNPAYKGKWRPPLIANEAYKGKWKPAQIDNPDYFEPHPYSQMSEITALGIELWTMSANIVIDNIYIGDDEAAAAKFAEQMFSVKQAQESLFESASSPSQGILSQLVSATEERPWLWVIYVLSVLIPIIVIAIACFGRKSSSPSDYKKTDEPQLDDDEVPDLVDDDDETAGVSPAAGGEAEVEVTSNDKSEDPSRRRSSRSTSASRIKSSQESAEVVLGDGAEDGEVEESEHGSPRNRRVRQRKQD